MSDSSSASKSGPFEEQRRIFDLLSQETRHLIIQYILGHPECLISLDELDYMVPKSKAAISDQLDNLIKAGLLDLYRYEPSEDKRDLPSKFYGLTEYGVEILHEYNYLRGIPVARVLYKNTRKSEKVERHENAPRPNLPDTVRDALSEDSEKYPQIVNYVKKRKSHVPSVDDQVKVVKTLLDADITPNKEGRTRHELADELGSELQYNIRTLLNHLVEINLVEEISPPSPTAFVISQRTNEIVNGEVNEEVKKNLKGLINHIDDELYVASTTPNVTDTPIAVTDGAGRTIRSILAEEFNLTPEKVESYLRKGDELEKLNAAVDAIKQSDSVTKGDAYDKIIFRRQAYRYRLTQKAIELAEN